MIFFVVYECPPQAEFSQIFENVKSLTGEFDKNIANL